MPLEDSQPPLPPSTHVDPCHKNIGAADDIALLTGQNLVPERKVEQSLCKESMSITLMAWSGTAVQYLPPPSRPQDHP